MLAPAIGSSWWINMKYTIFKSRMMGYFCTGIIYSDPNSVFDWIDRVEIEFITIGIGINVFSLGRVISKVLKGIYLVVVGKVESVYQYKEVVYFFEGSQSSMRRERIVA